MDLASILRDPTELTEEPSCQRLPPRLTLSLRNLPRPQDFFPSSVYPLNICPSSPTPSTSSGPPRYPGSPVPSLLSESVGSDCPPSPSPCLEPLSPCSSARSLSKTSHVKLKRKRATAAQLAALLAVFEKNFFPSTLERERLAAELNMLPRAVQIWFQNRRQNWRNTYGGGVLKKGVGAKTAEKNTKDWRFCAEFEKNSAHEDVKGQKRQKQQHHQRSLNNQPSITEQLPSTLPTPIPTPQPNASLTDDYFAYRPAATQPSTPYPASPFAYPYPYPSPCGTPAAHSPLPFPSPSIFDHPSPSPFTMHHHQSAHHLHQQQRQQQQQQHHQQSQPSTPTAPLPRPMASQHHQQSAFASPPVSMKLQIPSKMRKAQSSQVLPPISSILR